MSVAFRSWAARTLFNLSGCEDREGGERRRLRGDEELPAVCVWTGAKSEVLSTVTAGAISYAIIRWHERKLKLSSGRWIVGRKVDAVCTFCKF